MSAVRSRFPAVLAALAAGALLVSSGPPALATPATAARGASAQLQGVAALSKSDAWAVGSVIERWNGRRWSLVPGARSRRCGIYLYGVAARSASRAWAVGYCGTKKSHTPVIERWNGRRWSVQRSPGTPASSLSELNSVTATSASNAWAVGEYQSKGHTFPLVEHWNGRAWKKQGSADPGPHGADLEGVTALSATSAWAVGTALGASRLRSRSLIEHWNGRSWRLQPPISPGSENVLFGVSALSRTTAWAAGAYVFGSDLGTLVESWDGTSWQEPSTPGPDLHSYLLAVAARSSSDVWTVGGRAALAHPRTLIQHWDGTTWKVVPSPSPSSLQDLLQGVAVVSGRYAWAVGYRGHYQTLIEHWNGTTWTVQPSPN
jgi:hypothetical protein